VLLAAGLPLPQRDNTGAAVATQSLVRAAARHRESFRFDAHRETIASHQA
jgi:hypothetical protein